MRVGKIVGRVWSTRKIEQLPVGALKRVELESGAGSIIAFDSLDCGEDEEVLVVTGAPAIEFFQDRRPPVDAVIVASLDREASESTRKTK